MPTIKKSAAKKKPIAKPVKKSAAAEPAANTPSPSTLEQVIVGVVINIIGGALASAWPYIQIAVDHITKFELFASKAAESKRNDLVASFLELVAKLIRDAEQVRALGAKFEMSPVETGELMGKIVTRSLANLKCCSFEQLLAEVESHGLAQYLERALPK